MARPKKYGSAAEKQQAYRDKLLAQKAGVARGLVRNPKRFSSTQGEWEKNNGYIRLQEEGSKLNNEVRYYLIEHRDGHFAIRILSAKVKEMFHKYHTKKEAQDQFDSLVETGIVSEEWYPVDHYLDEAKRILLDGQSDSANISRHSNRYGLIFAISEAAYEGFKTADGQTFRKISPASEEFREARSSRIRRLLNAIGNKSIPEKTTGVLRDLENGIDRVVEDNHLKGKNISEKTVLDFAILIGSMFTHASIHHLDLFGQYHVVGDALVARIGQYIDVNKENAKGEGKIKAAKHHPHVPIDRLEKILGIAFQTNLQLYNFIILSLTTGNRPEDMDLLAFYKAKYLNSDGTLNYRHENPPAEVAKLPLGSKTWADVDRSSLNNPMLSIVGRMVLHYDHPALMPENFFTLNEKKKHILFREKFPDLRPYYERTLRTTCAKMLLYCGKAERNKATINDVQDRLAHATVETAQEIYAKNYPAATKPEAYFKIKEDGIKLRGKVVSHKSFLWDTYLLNDYYNRHRELLEKQNDTVGIRRLEDRIVREATIFNDNMG